MAKHKKRRRAARIATPPPSASWKRRLARGFRLVLTGFVPLTFLIGVWIYWQPESESHPLVPGLGIEAECAIAPEVKMAARIIDAETYRVTLLFGDLKELSCTELKIRAPTDLLDVIQLHDMKDFSLDSMREARQPFTNFRLTRNALGQPVLNIPVATLGSEPFNIELALRGVIQDSFEKFRLLIPNGMDIQGEPKLSTRPRVVLYSILVPSRFDTLEVMPQSTARKRQMGFEVLFFNAAEFSEVDVLFLDRRRDTWKTIFNIFAAAVATSLIATFISKWTQDSKGS
jgi:hypothetical protein